MDAQGNIDVDLGTCERNTNSTGYMYRGIPHPEVGVFTNIETRDVYI